MKKKKGEDKANHYISYGYNYYHIGTSYRYSGNDLSSPPAKLNQIQKPSETILILDSFRRNSSVWSGTSNVDDSYGDYEQANANAHNNGLNISWIDGHGSYKKIQNTANPYTAADLGFSTDASSLWNRD
jgi:prepilin-type processing-associated H-X9-DG protein